MRGTIGIVGFGEMGKRHGLEFKDATMGLVAISGVVEPDDARYEQGCEWVQETAVPRFNSVREMLEKSSPDGIVIASPNHTHLENLRECEGGDIPILLEKPLGASLEEVSEIVRFAERYKGVIAVDHVMRYAPIIQQAREFVMDGKIGEICSFQFSQRGDCGALFHTFRRSKASGGGQLIEKATHDLDVMLFLTDSRPERVAMIGKRQLFGGDRSDDLRCSECPDRLECPSVSHHATSKVGNGLKDVDVSNDLCAYAKGVDVADNETCLIELASGVFGTYSQNYFTVMPGHSRIYELIGDRGALYIELATLPEYKGKVTYFPRDKRGKIESASFDYFGKIHYNGGPYMARHFHELMRGATRTPFTTVNQAFVAEALGFAAMRAGDEGSFVNVDSIVPEDLKNVFSETYP